MYVLILEKMGWASFSAIFSHTHLVTLIRNAWERRLKWSYITQCLEILYIATLEILFAWIKCLKMNENLEKCVYICT
jgi:hypothetical protein